MFHGIANHRLFQLTDMILDGTFCGRRRKEDCADPWGIKEDIRTVD
jgi:hypothetical protein